MERKIGDRLIYTFHSKYRGDVNVSAVVMQVYPALYHKASGIDLMEMSIRYEDMGDVITEHGILFDDPKIKKPGS